MFTSIPAVESVTRTTVDADAAIPESAIGSSNATTKGSTRYAAALAAGVLLFGLLSPATATVPQKRVGAPSDMSVSANLKNDNSQAAIAIPERNSAMALMSHLPWLAPVGHRQPRKIDVPQIEAVSSWERQQQQMDEELDRKLVICRGC